MEKNTIGVIIALIGLILFLQSFNLEDIQKIIYLIIGIIMIIGGIIYARGKKE